MAAAPSLTEESSLWLHAWYDPLAAIKTHTSCVRCVDLNGDGDHKLLVGDMDKKLKVYKGTALISEHALLDVPVSICIFYPDVQAPRTPAVAAAAGSYVFIYRNLRPYFKFTVPPLEIDAAEQDIWNELRAGTMDATQAYEALANARDSHGRLTARSLDLLAIEDADKRDAFVVEQKALPHVQQTVITCMESIRKDREEPSSMSSLIVGTEAGWVYFLDPQGSNIIARVQMPVAPAQLSVSGLFDVEWRVMAVGRDGKLYNIKNGDARGTAVLTSHTIELDTHPVALTRFDKNVYVACMNNTLLSLSLRGRKNWTVDLGVSPRELECLVLKRSKVSHALLVALVDGNIRLYTDRTLVYTMHLEGTIHALRFAPYGREENALIVIHDRGSLTIKMLKRNASLEGTATGGTAPEQEIPLKIPKKTKLFVEQAQRERESAADMHQAFQRDLCKLKLDTARAFVKTLTDGEMGLSSVGGNDIRLHVTIEGLGPLFRLQLSAQNTSSRPLVNILVLLSYNSKMYRCRTPVLPLRVMLPNLTHKVACDIICVDPLGRTSNVRVLICDGTSAVPKVCAVVTMPPAEVDTLSFEHAQPEQYP